MGRISRTSGTDDRTQFAASSHAGRVIDRGTERGWRVKLLALAVGVVAAMLLAELGLRIAGVRMGGIIVIDDHWTGAKHIPNRVLVNNREGYAVVRINSVGIRDHETTVAKPDGVFRIALLGDSYIEARQVALDDAVSERLERVLNESISADAGSGPGHHHRGQGPFPSRYEVLNFGMNGYSTAQEYLRLREFVLGPAAQEAAPGASGFDPDVVLFAVQPSNDVRDNHAALAVGRRPFFHFTDSDNNDPPAGRHECDDGLVLDTSFRHPRGMRGRLRRDGSTVWHIASWIATHSRLTGIATEALRRTLWRPSDPQPTDHAPVDPQLARFHAGEADALGVYDPEPSGPWRDAWRITEALLLRTRDLCEQRRVPLVVVILNTSLQANRDARALIAEHYPQLDLEYPQRRVQRFCQSHQINCVPLAPAFLEHHLRTARFAHGFGDHMGLGHWNELGHDLACQCIYRYLRDADLLPDGGDTNP